MSDALLMSRLECVGNLVRVAENLRKAQARAA
jgi:hypothetical protein